MLFSGDIQKAYAFNVKPVRDQEHWTKMHGIAVYPPVYTKVMGRPRRNRKKDPEEKLMKEGGKKLTKHGVTMHCSLCGSADHNKKGHKKWEETTRDAPQPANVADDEEEEYDDPTIISNILPHTVHPHMDPSQTPGSMVFLMQQMERRAYQPSMDHGPLPESTFVAQARNDIPPPRVTTAMSRGRVRRRGVTEDIPEDVPQSSNQAGISRGRKRRSTGAGGAAAGRGGRGSREATGRGGRGFGASGASSRGGRGARGAAGRRGRGSVQQTSNQAAGRGAGEAYTGPGAEEAYTGPGAGFWNLMFGPNSESSYVQAEEEPVTQNAPNEEWIDDFQTL